MASEEERADASVPENPEPKFGLKKESVAFDVPDILGLVDRYSFVNHMRVASTGSDLRIAVADLNPIAKKPTAVVGFVMTHEYAKNFVAALKSVVDSLDKQIEKSSSGEIPESK